MEGRDAKREVARTQGGIVQPGMAQGKHTATHTTATPLPEE